jgi:hypothetical protein
MSRKDGKRPKTSAERERTKRLQVILPPDGRLISLLCLLIFLSFFLNILLLDPLIGPSADIFEFVGFRRTRLFPASPS